MRRFRAVLFDWDGTLADSSERSYVTYQRLFHGYGLHFDRALYRESYSPDWYRTYERVGLPRERWREADARWLEIYAEGETALLPGAREALAKLRRAGLVQALVTSGSRARIEAELARLELAPLFAAVICSEDVTRRKPDPEGMRLALERLAIGAAEAVYVGDSPEDVAMARQAEVFSIGIPGGFPNREALIASRPDRLAADLRGALETVLGLEPASARD